MLVTKHPVLRRFWYALAPISRLETGPWGTTLLGTPLVLWLTPEGKPAALIDRCCHRTAKLSIGWVDKEAGGIACGYHGWTFDASGKCIRIPQWKDQSREIGFGVEAFLCEERYGYVWVCLDREPIAPIPDIPEASDPAFRQIHEFHEVWNAPGLRIMENSFDTAHFSYVHRESFGIIEEPEIPAQSLEPMEHGFFLRTLVPVKNPEQQRKNLGMAEERTTRDLQNYFWMPFSRRMRLDYPNGVTHTIVTCTAPVDDRSSIVCQFAFRNDTEAEAPAAGVIAFDRQVTNEDRVVLEACEYDVPLDIASGREFHMPSDRPGIEMRRMLKALFAAHGESEDESPALAAE